MTRPSGEDESVWLMICMTGLAIGCGLVLLGSTGFARLKGFPGINELGNPFAPSLDIPPWRFLLQEGGVIFDQLFEVIGRTLTLQDAFSDIRFALMDRLHHLFDRVLGGFLGVGGREDAQGGDGSGEPWEHAACFHRYA